MRKVRVIPFSPDSGELDLSNSYYIPIGSMKHEDSSKFPSYSIKPGLNQDPARGFSPIFVSDLFRLDENNLQRSSDSQYTL